MPNQITSAGLETKSYDDLVLELNTAIQSIYGADANLDSDTPDGQWIGQIVQAAIDNLDLAAQIFSSFDPDQAIGRALDQRASINGVIRKGGTFTITPIDITTDRALNLAGLDGELDNPDGTGYTVSDDAGNQFILAASQVIAAAGTYTYNFRAKNSGAVQTVPNTITVPVTIVLGVTEVNNPTTFTTLGIDQETDSQLRIRRRKSVALSSKGFLDGLTAALENINGVTFARVYENVAGSPDGDGIPGHSIWVIVQGGTDADIGLAIYSKRNAGAGMKGTESVIITQVDGSFFEILFDRTADENLYIEFDAESIDGVGTIDATYIKNQLVELFVPAIFEKVNINKLATVVQQIDPNCLVTNAGFALSGGGPFTDTLEPTTKNLKFAVSAARISITVI